MKRTPRTFLSFALCVSVLSGTVVRADAAADDPIVAKGKGFQVHRSQLEEAWTIYQSRFPGGGPPDAPRQSVEAKLLNHIIETEILMGRATAEEKARAKEGADAVYGDSRKRFGTEEDFKGWLKSMGMTPDSYRRRVMEQRTSEAVIDRELQPGAKVSDEDVKKYYEQNLRAFDKPEQVRGRQIFLSAVDPATRQPLSDQQKQAKEKLANEIKARLDRGEDFLKLYREFSEQPGAKKGDADEMLFSKGEMGPEFDAVAFTLKTNSISGVISSQRGYHIVRVSVHEPATRLAYAEVAPRLRKFMVSLEIRKQMPAYLERIQKEAGTEILQSEERSKSVVTSAARNP